MTAFLQHRRSSVKYHRSEGFALIASLSIMAVLVMIAVALYSMSSVATRTASIASARAKAEANAKMALNIALGELQQHLGPDKRVSARGLTLAQHPEMGSSENTSVSPESLQAWWVGVASSDKTETIGANNRAVVWLLSGLDDGASSKEQIDGTSSFEREIKMFDEGSIDTRLTGGEPVTAGALPIGERGEKSAGSYAYFIDDNGMKAQLAAKDPELTNEDVSAERPGGTIIPGSYDLSILDGMSDYSDVPVEDYLKLHSLEHLPLLLSEGDDQISKEKRMSYTTRSLGVLADAKEGRLKKDLTIAFENQVPNSGGAEYPVFEKVFPKSSSSQWDRYLLVDDSKYGEFSGSNGYIHWGMLRDYYNIKRYIRRSDTGSDYLEPVLIDKAGVGGGSNINSGMAPHDYGPETPVNNGDHQELPYGDYDVNNQKPTTHNYKHSPVTPIIARLQYNVWLEKYTVKNPQTRKNEDVLRINNQVWVSHYNAFNIPLLFNDSNGRASVRMIGMPQATFAVPDSINLEELDGNGNRLSKNRPAGYHSMDSLQKRQYHVPKELILEPGRGHMCAFDRNVESGQESDGQAYNNLVQNLSLDSVFDDYKVTSGSLPESIDWFVDIYPPGDYLAHGMDQLGGDFEISQILWSPIALESVNGRSNNTRPGKKLEFPDATYNFNTMGSFAMKLRSTNEPGESSLRPVIDSNIRGMFFNPRWDSPLGLDMVASYVHIAEDDVDDSDDIEQIPQMATEGEEGFTYWGAGHDPFAGYDRVILFDVAREDLVSLGQLQHANLGRFSYEPSYIVGNSYANPRIPLDDWKASVTDSFSSSVGAQEISGSFALYDASYLVNEVLWDSYIFTTIPQLADNYEDSDEPEPNAAHFTALLEGEEQLPNPRFIPYEPEGSTFTIETLQDEGDGGLLSGGFHHNAGHLLVDGAFNVNSTSVDAWEAFLSGTYGIPYKKMDEQGQVTSFETTSPRRVRFPRVQSVFGGAMHTARPDENFWIGFRALTQEEVRELAEEVVDQIIKRGPFLTLGDFINRKLETGELGERGTLQAALDETINQPPLNGYDMGATHPELPDDSNQAAGFPGQLLQGDILQSLSPFMTVRSDTFTIRAYGDSLAPNGQILSKVWCEAVVQRLPDPKEPDPNKPFLEELVQPSGPSGRTFKLVSFRWLNEDEI